MQEKICKKIKKDIFFEKSGEIFSVEISLENISSDFQKQKLTDCLDTLYKDVLKELIF